MAGLERRSNLEGSCFVLMMEFRYILEFLEEISRKRRADVRKTPFLGVIVDVSGSEILRKNAEML